MCFFDAVSNVQKDFNCLIYFGRLSNSDVDLKMGESRNRFVGANGVLKVVMRLSEY